MRQSFSNVALSLIGQQAQIQNELSHNFNISYHILCVINFESTDTDCLLMEFLVPVPLKTTLPMKL